MNWNMVKRKLKVNKEGILGGALVGLAAAMYVKQLGVDMLFAVEQPGIIDSIITTLPPEQMAFLKFAIVYATVGALIGYWIDDVIKPGK